jgi:drug/metabolite transporter (DMT)-like permease
MSILIKLVSDRGVSLPEIVFWRQAFALPVVLLVLWHGPGLVSVATQRFGAHLGRSVVGLVCMVMNFTAITLLPLAEATTLSYATPIFATLMGLVLFGEQVGLKRGLAIFAGFIGVLFVAQPSGAQLDPLGTILGLGAALLVALISFQIRDLGKTESATTTVFWFTALSTFGMLFLLPFVWQPHDGTSWLMLLAMGTLGGIAQFAMVASLRHAPVSTVVGMDYISLVWTTIAGWLIWQQVPGPSTWIGAAIIIASGLFIAWREHRLALERAREVVG